MLSYVITFFTTTDTSPQVKILRMSQQCS